MSEHRGGKIITFYSYKGGTGRSMALVNLAWVLASNRKKVFVIDWDLEAPGLHRYFRPFIIDKELDGTNGLIDIVHRYVDDIIGQATDAPLGNHIAFRSAADTAVEAILMNSIMLSREHPESGELVQLFPQEGLIEFLPAGRQVPTYAEKVNTFSWSDFYTRYGGGVFLEQLRERLRQEYDYILIDSRTGVSDTSGISTVQMPDTLAVCFTYNNQSINGAAAVAQSVHAARSSTQLGGEKAGRGEPFRIFPIPTRVEDAERAKLRSRQMLARERFAPFLSHIPEVARGQYWNDVEIPYRPFHAYEETLAALTDDPGSHTAILGSILRIARKLTNGDIQEYASPVPDDVRKEILADYATAIFQSIEDADPEPFQSLGPQQSMDAALATLSASDLAIAAQVFLRMVELRIGSAGEVISLSPVSLNKLPAEQQRVATALVHVQLLSFVAASNSDQVEIANKEWFRSWPQSARWIEQERQFLLWRTQLSDLAFMWSNQGREPSRLLIGQDLQRAVAWLSTHGKHLLDEECQFIEASRNAAAEPLDLRTVPRPEVRLSPSGRRTGMALGIVILLALAAVPILNSTSDPEPGPAKIAHASPAEKNLVPVIAEPRATVYYLQPPGDPEGPLGDMLTKTGYKVERADSVNGTTANAVWFGCEAPVEARDIVEVTEAGLRSGLRLRAIKVLPGGEIHIKSDTESAAQPILDADRIRQFDWRAACEQLGRTAEDVQRRSQAVIQYFAKPNDPLSLVSELKKLGYSVEIGTGRQGVPTNTLWLSCSTMLTNGDIHQLGKTLLDQNVKLRKIDVFRIDKHVTQLGATPNLVTPVLTVQQIEAIDLEKICNGRKNVRRAQLLTASPAAGK